MTARPLFHKTSSVPAYQGGGAFFLLAFFAGMLGGMLGLPFLHVQPSAGVVVAHALLMTLYVVCPVMLGGMAQWFLPKLLKGEGMALPTASHAGFVLLAVGVFLLPVMPYGGLALWALGMLALAVNVLATILEMRSITFRAFPPLIWTFVGSALSVLIVAPVLLAFLVRSGFAGGGATALLAVLHGGVEMSLLSIPSLGIIVAALLPAKAERGMVVRCAPYAFGVMGLVPVLCWADHLFGGLSSTAYRVGLVVGLAMPCLALLGAFLVDMWRARLPSGPVASWASGGLVLLLAGWILMVLGDVQSLPFGLSGAASHQLVMFGSLLALGAAFYAWCSTGLAQHNKGLAFFGSLHAFVTFIGAVCSVMPQLALPAVILMTASLVMFGLVAGRLWYALLVARANIRAELECKG
ncbi:heme-copper oxidase family protein [Bombella pollinis]|uniref:Cytochrome oxidase subunit I profile domain-containing protein n=1 Tax=Bombella pollinis TaxID=2967337 RepID=A0ABT3WL36_9PROT|nr:hypothetical protein [Bombella pollinis]MCX5619761.1 hypothetical protein [Bombella pollinis]